MSFNNVQYTLGAATLGLHNTAKWGPWLSALRRQRSELIRRSSSQLDCHGKHESPLNRGELWLSLRMKQGPQ